MVVELRSFHIVEKDGDVSGLDDRGRNRSVKIDVKAFLSGYVVYLFALGTASFFAGGNDGTRYVAYFMTIGYVVAIAFIPVAGLVTIAFFDEMTTTLMMTFGLVHGTWIDVMINGLSLVIAVVSQIYIVTRLSFSVVPALISMAGRRKKCLTGRIFR